MRPFANPRNICLAIEGRDHTLVRLKHILTALNSVPSKGQEDELLKVLRKTIKRRKDVKMKKLVFPSSTLGFAIGFAGPSSAQEGKTTLTGPLIDKTCAKRVAKKGLSSEEVAKLVRECSLREYGGERGLGVFAGGRFYEFDKRGN